jgi:hypothetical protein
VKASKEGYGRQGGGYAQQHEGLIETQIRRVDPQMSRRSLSSGFLSSGFLSSGLRKRAELREKPVQSIGGVLVELALRDMGQKRTLCAAVRRDIPQLANTCSQCSTPASSTMCRADGHGRNRWRRRKKSRPSRMSGTKVLRLGKETALRRLK